MIDKSIQQCSKGTIFLLLNGESRLLGIVTYHDSGDRGPGSVDWILENGTKDKETDFFPEFGNGTKVIMLDKVEAIGNNPLRTLLNWAAQHGG